MKIRIDFVANSSSSGFIIMLDKKLEGVGLVDYLKEKLFYGATHVNYHCNSYDHEVWLKIEGKEDCSFWNDKVSTDALCHTILENLREVETVDQLAIELEGEDFYHSDDEYPEYSKMNSDNEEERDEFDKLESEYALRQAQKIWKVFKEDEGMFIYAGEFSDNDGTLESQIEHGEVFGGLRYCFKFSHH